MNIREMMEKPDQARGSKNIKLALIFGVVVFVWYIVAMMVIWTQ
jgi:hypothetical protein